MKVTKIVTKDGGESFFEDIDIPVSDHGSIGFLSEIIKATGIIFRETSADYDYEQHNTPNRQFVIILEGGVEMETSLGEKRQFGAGDVVLLEDTTGKGHASRAINRQVRRSIFVTLD